MVADRWSVLAARYIFLTISPLARGCPSSGGREEMAGLRGYGLTEEERAETLEDARARYVVSEVEIAA